MLIVVASGNIFRRELVCFTIDEAGHQSAEARTLAELSTLLVQAPPDAVVVDAQLDDAPPVQMLRVIRSRTPAPLLWLAASPKQLSLDDPRSDMVEWPVQAAELAQQIASLVARGEAVAALEALRERCAGYSGEQDD